VALSRESGGSRRRTWDIALTASFLGALFAPTIDQVVRTDVARGPGPELRRPAPQPDPPRTWSELALFPAAYEQHHRDTFGLRDVLLAGNSLVKFYGFRVGPSPILVPDGLDWIDLAGNETLTVLRGLLPFTRAELEGWQALLENREAALAQLDIRYLFVIIPNKETIYRERVPARYNQVGPTRLDQLVDWLEKHSKARILDLRPQFLVEKAHDEPGNYLYNPLGTHWGGRGCLCAYRALVERIRQWFPKTRALSAREYEMTESAFNADTWATSMYIPRVLVQREWHLNPRPDLRTEPLNQDPGPPRRDVYGDLRASGPRVLAYHDSFLPAIAPMCAATFSKFEIITGPGFDLETIARSRPEMVLEIFVERSLVMPTTPQPVLANLLSDSVESVFPEVLLSSGIVPLESLFAHGSLQMRGVSEGGDVQTVWFDVKEHSTVYLSIGLEVATDSLLDVYWRSEESGPFERGRRFTIPIRANSATKAGDSCSVTGPRCQLLLRLRGDHRVATIRSLELRAAVK
jgi:hypothetical protein